jgi:hypothetical protein
MNKKTSESVVIMRLRVVHDGSHLGIQVYVHNALAFALERSLIVFVANIIVFEVELVFGQLILGPRPLASQKLV